MKCTHEVNWTASRRESGKNKICFHFQIFHFFFFQWCVFFNLDGKTRAEHEILPPVQSSKLRTQSRLPQRNFKTLLLMGISSREHLGLNPSVESKSLTDCDQTASLFETSEGVSKLEFLDEISMLITTISSSFIPPTWNHPWHWTTSTHLK